jgi:hypothetical protein
MQLLTKIDLPHLEFKEVGVLFATRKSRAMVTVMIRTMSIMYKLLFENTCHWQVCISESPKTCQKIPVCIKGPMAVYVSKLLSCRVKLIYRKHQILCTLAAVARPVCTSDASIKVQHCSRAGMCVFQIWVSSTSIYFALDQLDRQNPWQHLAIHFARFSAI